MILDGTLGQGERLIERDLCEQLSVSRTSLREALKAMELVGMVMTCGCTWRFVLAGAETFWLSWLISGCKVTMLVSGTARSLPGVAGALPKSPLTRGNLGADGAFWLFGCGTPGGQFSGVVAASAWNGSSPSLLTTGGNMRAVTDGEVRRSFSAVGLPLASSAALMWCSPAGR